MKKALIKKDASEVKDGGESKWWLDDEELNQLIAEDPQQQPESGSNKDARGEIRCRRRRLEKR